MHRAFIDTLTFEGFLEKQGKLKTWSWKKYWFVLEDDQLCYFKTSSKVSGQGLIDMAQAQTVRVVEISRGPSLEIVTPNRTHVLCASDGELREKWLKYLRQAMMLRKRRSSLMMRPSCDSISDDEDHHYEAVHPESAQNGCQEGVSPTSEQMVGRSEIMHTNSLYVPQDRPESEDSHLYAEVSDLACKKIEWKDSATPPYAVVNKDKGLAKHSGAVSNQMSLTRLQYQTSYAEPFDSRMTDANTGDHDYDEVFSEATPEKATTTKPSEDVDHSSDSDSCDEEVNNNEKIYEEVEQKLIFNFPNIPPLPNPRLELTWGSAFDDIRTFIATNRRPNELYAIPRKSERGGKAIKKLKDFLTGLDQQEGCE